MPSMTRSRSLYAAATPSATVVTPPINEFEQASFYAATASSFCQDQFGGGDEQRQPPINVIHSTPSFYSPLAAGGAFVGGWAGRDRDAFESIALLASATAGVSVSSTLASNDASPQEPQETADDANDVMDAAEILCGFKNNDVATDCSPRDAMDIVDMAVGMLTGDPPREDAESVEEDHMLEEDHQHDGELPRESDNAESSTANALLGSFVHPSRLATEDDAAEVNKLHQYGKFCLTYCLRCLIYLVVVLLIELLFQTPVRKDLLEIFVVSETITTRADNGGDGNQEKEDPAKNIKSTQSSIVTRRRSSPVSVIPAPSVVPTADHQRYYPGRVGLRCVHCARARRKSALKPAFYPRGLKNIYREVCAWQRIHFKKCRHVPADVRARYDHYKRIDATRGKVAYWEAAAKKIGLRNNPDR